MQRDATERGTMTTTAMTSIDTTTQAWTDMMSAYNALTHNHDEYESDRLLGTYRELSRRVTDPTYTGCPHGSIEQDETQVDVDRFRSEPEGTCEDCGMRVEWVVDCDPDGCTTYLSELEDQA